MKKRNKQAFISVTIILLWSVNIFAQAPDTLWTRTYGGAEGDGGSSVQQTTDGGYIIAGGTSSYGAGYSDVYLIKTDKHGNTIWTKTYGGTSYDGGDLVQQTSDGGYIICGFTYSFGAGNGDVYLIKTDSNGDTLWTRTYGGTGRDEGSSVQQTSDGGYIVCGYTYSFGAGVNDVYLIRTDLNGDTLWTKTYGGTGIDGGDLVQQTMDGGYIIIGWTTSFGNTGKIYLIKTNANGDTIWTQRYDGAYGTVSESGQITSDEGYIIVGETHPNGLEATDVYLIKTDKHGDSLWAKTYGEIYSLDYGLSVCETYDSGYIIAGQTYLFDPYGDVYLIKTDVNGDTLWTKTYGGAEGDAGYSVQQTSDGGYIIAGGTVSFGAGNGDVYLIKVLPEGAIPQAWINPSSFSVALHQEGSRIEPLVIGNSGNGLLTWSINENPEVNWLTEDTISGSVYPEDSVSISLTFDATGLSQGLYFDTLVMSTNDTNNPTINVPIELRVIVSDVIFVFPNPFMPKQGHTILTFANLPNEGTIKIYTIAGNLVWNHSFAHPEIFYSWDLRNDDDKDIASGIYIYLVKDKSGDVVKKGKFAVVR